jgi:hypothetical protein
MAKRILEEPGHQFPRVDRIYDAIAAEQDGTPMNVDPQNLPARLAVLIPILILLVLWDVVWKLMGMWKSGRNNQLAWFICLAIFNTVGILPILYLVWCQKDRNPR